MRKVIVLLIVLLLGNGVVSAKDLPYKTLEFSFVCGNITDAYLTRSLLKLPNYQEANWFAKFNYSSDTRAVISTVVVSVIQVLVFEKLRKSNKTTGYILMSVLLLAKSYAVYNNYHLWRHR